MKRTLSQSPTPKARIPASGPPNARSAWRAPRKTTTDATIGTSAAAAKAIHTRAEPDSDVTDATRIDAGTTLTSAATAPRPTAVPNRTTADVLPSGGVGGAEGAGMLGAAMYQRLKG